MKPQASPDEVLQALARAAVVAFGAERAAAQRMTLEGTAAAISRVLREPLELTAAEPDFVNGGR